MNTIEAKEFFERLKTAHELPNDNSGEYNIGYVDAMNTAINTVIKLDVGSVVKSCDHPTGTNKKGMVYVCDNCIDKFNFG